LRTQVRKALFFLPKNKHPIIIKSKGFNKETNKYMKKNIIVGVLVLVVVALATVFLVKTPNKIGNSVNNVNQAKGETFRFSGESTKIENNVIFIKGMYELTAGMEAKKETTDVQAKIGANAKITRNSYKVPGSDIKPGQAFSLDQKSEAVSVSQMMKDLTANHSLTVIVKSASNIADKTQFETSEVSYEFPIYK